MIINLINEKFTLHQMVLGRGNQGRDGGICIKHEKWNYVRKYIEYIINLAAIPQEKRTS
jgi:hypothetical protein